jgi:hypothetical protein
MAPRKNEIVEESYYTLILCWEDRITKFFPKHNFLFFFTTIQLIYTLVYISGGFRGGRARRAGRAPPPPPPPKKKIRKAYVIQR